MKKKTSLLVIWGIILCVIGLVVVGASVTFAVKDYEAFTNYTDKEIVLDEDINYDFEFATSDVVIHKTTEAKTKITAKLVKDTDLTLEGNKIAISKKNIWGVLSMYFKNKIDIYLGTDIENNDIKILINASTLKSDTDITLNKFNFEANASSGDLKNIIADSVNMKINAGSFEIKDSTIDKLNIDVNAGNVKIKTAVNTFTFVANASSIDSYIKGAKADYKRAVDLAAASSNLGSSFEGTKTISGKVTAGSADFEFES